MMRRWQRELRNEDLAARHTYGLLESGPPDAPAVCPHCHSGSLYAIPCPETPVLCNNCGRSYNEDQLK